MSDPLPQEESKGKIFYLKRYKKEVLGVDPSMNGTNQTGDSLVCPMLPATAEHVSTLDDALITDPDPLTWKAELPTATQLYH